MENGECLVTIQLDVEDPLARMTASRTIHATDAYLALYKVKEMLGKIVDADHEGAHEMFNCILEDCGINLEELP